MRGGLAGRRSRALAGWRSRGLAGHGADDFLDIEAMPEEGQWPWLGSGGGWRYDSDGDGDGWFLRVSKPCM
ncbi:hypothetical protein AMTR_s00006p00248710 [Amborella trichopoda]|uniref:Uncharacterized protein n=1 Tax=Amborella trichopoda TaxID=13333 RepID=W1P796_AMBTC|nr:hypothetical protein AMTR_s00006p00248710 [Amborella trichopoda]